MSAWVLSLLLLTQQQSQACRKKLPAAYRYLVCNNTEVFVANSTAEVAAIVAKFKGTGKTIRALSHR
jgi:hypothetical protein